MAGALVMGALVGRYQSRFSCAHSEILVYPNQSSCDVVTTKVEPPLLWPAQMKMTRGMPLYPPNTQPRRDSKGWFWSLLSKFAGNLSQSTSNARCIPLAVVVVTYSSCCMSVP